MFTSNRTVETVLKAKRAAAEARLLLDRAEALLDRRTRLLAAHDAIVHDILSAGRGVVSVMTRFVTSKN